MMVLFGLLSRISSFVTVFTVADQWSFVSEFAINCSGIIKLYLIYVYKVSCQLDN
jgi:hypothetical protein